MVRYTALKGLYDVEKTIGCGGFAKVKLATHTATGEKVAIKIMNKSVLGSDLHRVTLELKALKTLTHEHICKLYQVIETETHFFLVVEYCSGGELFDHIVEKNRLTENESRKFFGEIVSAVAYLHSLGYIHRDLKPENVLLDGEQTLKLIDFGLCARPEGGVETPLYTSCGSPTYAAPELVLGRQYLGPEVDVWAMGVLLYALLSGFLPFDDQNIDNLYKKILAGRYEEPQFMSSESKKLIKSMLQVNPKHRITVDELLMHPWLTNNLKESIRFKPQSAKRYDEDCILVMAQYNHITPESMWRHIKKWRYDYDTATYLLLMARKKRGMPLKLNAVNRFRFKLNQHLNNNKQSNDKAKHSEIEDSNLKAKLLPPNSLGVKPDILTNVVDVKTPKKSADTENIPPSCNKNEDPVTPNENNFVEPRKPSSIRKPLKRLRSPNLDGDCSPVPIKITPGRQVSVLTPDKNTPGSARKVLGSIERSINKVRHVLTPRKNLEQPTTPVMLNPKNMCNVSTTSCRDPEFVITELTKALQKKGILCERKGFRLRGKMEPNKYRFGGCSFELEICLLPTLGSDYTTAKNSTPKNNGVAPSNDTPIKSSMKHGTGALQNVGAYATIPAACIGIRRKRLKGDSWCYKKVCEQVLALTATDLRQQIGSPV